MSATTTPFSTLPRTDGRGFRPRPESDSGERCRLEGGYVIEAEPRGSCESAMAFGCRRRGGLCALALLRTLGM